MSITLDGFVCGPNNEMNWMTRSMSDEGAEWTLDKISNAGLHIMGSTTFKSMRAYWPSSGLPFAEPMNKIPKAVFTQKGAIELTGIDDTSGNLQSWNDACIATGDLAEEIKRLKAQPGKYILAHGGAGFAQSLIATGLVDEYQLAVHPVVLGSGKPIFTKLHEPLYLTLLEDKTFSSGTRACVYRKNVEN